jgi:hypothetical protein
MVLSKDYTNKNKVSRFLKFLKQQNQFDRASGSGFFQGVVQLLGFAVVPAELLPHEKLCPTIDRTEWDFGKTQVNVLCVAVAIDMLVMNRRLQMQMTVFTKKV